MAYSGVIQQEEAAATVVLKVTGCEEAGDPSLTSARTLKLRPQHPALVGRVCRSRQKVDSFNVIFDSKVLSRQHAVMSYEGGKFLLKDLNSANGTFVNQRRLGSEEDFQLFVGDVIQFGQDVYDGNDRYSCVIVVAAEMIHPDGRHHNATRGDGCKESEAAGVKHEYQVEDEQQVALSALHDCLREVTVRELSISKRLNKTQTVLDEVRRAVADKWQGEVDQDILLSKISLLQQEVTSKNSEKNSSTMQRKLHYEENVKRMLYEASKGRVDAEVKVRASKAEEKLESRSRTPASPPSSLPPPSTSPTASQRNSEELLEKLQQLAAAASSEVAFTQHQVASLQRSLTRLGRSHKLALDAIIAVSAFLAIVSALYLLSFQVKEQITLNTW